MEVDWLTRKEEERRDSTGPGGRIPAGFFAGAGGPWPKAVTERQNSCQ